MKKYTDKQRAIVQEAIRFIREGGTPKKVVAENDKTRYSIMDNLPRVTCAAIGCPVADKCYDIGLINMRPTVLKARAERHYLMQLHPDKYFAMLVGEFARFNATKVRIYGGGDYFPAQLELLQRILKSQPSTMFYMISKSIREFPTHAKQLLRNKNFFLNLSEMRGFTFGPKWQGIRRHSRVNTVYTLMPDETDLRAACKADIVFNVSRRRADIDRYKAAGVPLCPCDAKDMPAKDACDSCGLCATKGGVRCRT